MFTYQEDVAASVAEVNVRFEGVVVEGRGQQAPGPRPPRSLSDQQPLPEPWQSVVIERGFGPCVSSATFHMY